MKRRTLKLLAALGLLALGTLTGVIANMQSGQGRVEVSYGVPQPVTLREPIVVEFSVENGLHEQIKLNLGHDRKSSFVLTVTEPGGSVVRVPPLLAEGVGRIGRLSLKPSETYTQRLLLNEWYDFGRPGTYEVDISLSTPVRAEGGADLNVSTAGRLSVKVAPRDEGRLRQRSEELAETVLGASSYEEAAEAALALSHIADPVAVPSLEKILGAGRLAEVAVAGLERIGGGDAVEVLIAALKRQSGETSALARSALAKIESESSDSALKERIRRAL